MLYKELAELYKRLDSTSKRLEKTYYISELIKKTPKKDLEKVVLLAQGKIFPDWTDKKIGVASKLVVKAISKATGASVRDIEEAWRKHGDLGDVARNLLEKRKQASLMPKELELDWVFMSLRKLAEHEGKGSVESKVTLISELLINAGPDEARYITRTVLDKLRVGIGSGSMRDAIIWAFFSEELGIRYNSGNNDIELSEADRAKYNQMSEKVQYAYDLINDFGELALRLKERGLKGLDEVSLEVGKPINAMLFQKAKDIGDAFSIVGKPAAFEYKYDGFRMQIHIVQSKVQIFTRRLEDVTEQFPEVVDALKKSIRAKSCILDAEAVGYSPATKKYVPFQKISQRIKRKYNIDEMAKKFPVEINIFDIIYYDGKSTINEPFHERRKFLEKIVKEKPFSLVLAKQLITSDEKEAQDFYNESLKMGEEGAMAKNLEGIYKPGSRVGYGVKIKSIMDPLDLVIVAAEYGEGKRSGWLTSFYLACSDNGKLVEIGKVSTGLKELEEQGTTFKEMTGLLKPLVRKSSGKFVELKPEIVIEVGYEEIQKSVNYSSGYALRFPRFIRLRTDEKTVDDINTAEDVEQLYEQQRARG
ncbi:TPA: ATP-dependent DNA ligase [Candidatus Woesearchaeota archaeon]|nr:DNA ligase [archaeon GW2011_AR15]MBS3103497.1 ATP-dependent DNA ligase [Candidatus Woesearchaeota archaeon]HIH41615.1 ATP-dependent DNA ligase [Candidatus Woesearchaeota archaeon]